VRDDTTPGSNSDYQWQLVFRPWRHSFGSEAPHLSRVMACAQQLTRHSGWSRRGGSPDIQLRVSVAL